MSLLSKLSIGLHTISANVAVWISSLEASDSSNLFQLVWLPFNLYLLIRLL